MAASVLLASAAVLGFAQSAPGAMSGHQSQPGALVASVVARSPAGKAGLSRGDIILEVNGVAVSSQADVWSAISTHEQGDSISRNICHGDLQKTLSVALGEKDGRIYMGVLLFPNQGERTGMLGSGREGLFGTLTEGVVVARVTSGSPAERAGITKGEVILSVDGVPVNADHSMRTLILDKKIGDVAMLSVESPITMKAQTRKVTLGNTPDKKPWLGVEYRMGFPTLSWPPGPIFRLRASIYPT